MYLFLFPTLTSFYVNQSCQVQRLQCFSKTDLNFIIRFALILQYRPGAHEYLSSSQDFTGHNPRTKSPYSSASVTLDQHLAHLSYCSKVRFKGYGGSQEGSLAGGWFFPRLPGLSLCSFYSQVSIGLKQEGIILQLQCFRAFIDYNQ